MHDYAWSCLLSVNVNAWSAARSKHAGGRRQLRQVSLPNKPLTCPAHCWVSRWISREAAWQHRVDAILCNTKWDKMSTICDMYRYVSKKTSKFQACVCISLRWDSNSFGPAGLNRFKMIQTCIRQVQFCLGTPTCQASTFTAPPVECGTWCLKHLGTVSRPNCRTSCKNRERERGRETVQWGVQYLLSIFQYWYVWYVRYWCSWVGNEGSNGR